MNHRLIILAGLCMSLAGIAHADESVAEQTKDGVHAAANDIDKGAHKAKRSMTHHARRTKTDIQNSGDHNALRKGSRRMKDAGHDAADKADDTVHGR